MTLDTIGGYKARIPAHVRGIMERLAEAGYESYLVGGAVRDMLLDSTPADFDLTSNATPEQILRVFHGFTVVPTGIAHGTVTVISSGYPIEITTYRIDGSYSDARRPDGVSFSKSLAEDVKRRDFTINALAMDSEGNVIDYVGGVADLENKLIRSVGEPGQRLQEDALRILRALRFSAVLGFPIEKETRRSLFRHKNLLPKVSAERIWSELTGLICGEYADQVLLYYARILGVVIPEILPMRGFNQHNPHHCYDVLEHTAYVVKNTPPDKTLRLAALFHDIGKPVVFVMDADGIGHFYGHQKVSRDIAHDVLLRLKADNRTRERVETLVLWHDVEIEPSEKIIRRRLGQFGESLLRDLLTLKRADTLAQSEKSRYRLEEQANIYKLLDIVLSGNACFSMKDLAVNGDDLLRMGAPRGPGIGVILDELLRLVIDGELPNDREKLLKYVYAKETQVKKDPGSSN